MVKSQKMGVKETILEVAAKKFAHYGYDKTTIEEIAKDADIGKGSIYLHFRSKEEILLELVSLGQIELIDRWTKIQESKLTPEKKLYNLLKTRLTYVMDKRRSFFLFSVKPERLFHKIVSIANQFKPKLLNILESVLLEGEKKEVFFIKDRSQVALTFYEMVSNILFRTNFDQDFPYESYFDNAFVLTLSGIIKKGEARRKKVRW